MHHVAALLGSWDVPPLPGDPPHMLGVRVQKKVSTQFEFFELKTPVDLFSKLEADLAELEDSGQDTRTAFNFFVTAEHLPDWLGKRDLVKKNPILRIVSHIANGAKHLHLDESRHKSVTTAKKSHYVEAGYVEPGYFYEPLLIHLSEEESKHFGISDIDVVTLGKRVLEFWKPYVFAS